MSRATPRSLGHVVLVLVVVVLAFAPTAYAGGSAQRTLAVNGGNIQSGVQSGSNQITTATQSERAAGFPFTSLDITMALGGGLMLLGCGVVLGHFLSRESRAVAYRGNAPTVERDGGLGVLPSSAKAEGGLRAMSPSPEAESGLGTLSPPSLATASAPRRERS